MDNLQKIKDKRWERFLLRDKDPYICYRFTLTLEKLMPVHLTQIKPVMVSEDMPDTGEQMTIELEPEKVFDRYVKRLYEDYTLTGYEHMSDIKHLAHQYATYLESTQEERLRLYIEDKKLWERFI